MIGSGIVEGLTSALARMVGRNLVKWGTAVMSFLGISFVTYEAITEPIMTFLHAKLGQLPATITQWMGALGIDVAITILVSAMLTCMLFKFGIRKRGT